MILEGAARVFSERGVRDVSVEDLLHAAGVSRRTFYRLFGSKDDALVALFRMTTDVFMEACKRAVREEPDPLRQIERCIDTYIDFARRAGRLTFVLMDDAQRHESPLHERQVETLDTLVALLASGTEVHVGKRIDPLLSRALISSLEGVVRLMFLEADEGRGVRETHLTRAKNVMMRILTATLEGEGPRVTPLPTTKG